MRTPLVSIVTPCLNAGDRLARCLDSVASQTYANVEHIVVDGGSNDGTLELMRARGVRFVSEPDSGQADALNKAVRLARGEWLGWLNADDTLVPRAVQLALAAAAASPPAGWVYGQCVIRRGDRSEVWTPPRSVTAATLELGNVIAQPGTLIARWALDRVGPFDRGLQLVMDYDLWLRLVDAGVPSAYVSEPLATFEVHDESKTGTVPPRSWDLERVGVLARRGHREAAAVMLGRTAAISARGGGHHAEHGRVELDVEHSLAEARRRGLHLDPVAVRAGAWCEAIERELLAPERRFRHLLRPEPWRIARTRRRLLRVVRAALFRRLMRRTREQPKR